jgi:sulfur-oxidizing protein SoxX
MGTAMAAALLAALLPARARAQQCQPKTTGYFQQMATASQGTPSPIEMAGIIVPLNGAIGDPARGRLVMVDQYKGNCLACHRVPSLSEEPSHGDLGKNLSGVGGRYTEGQLRQILVDPKALFPNTVMPAFHVSPQFRRTPQQLAGQTILSADEVEDVVAFLKNLR